MANQANNRDSDPWLLINHNCLKKKKILARNSESEQSSGICNLNNTLLMILTFKWNEKYQSIPL